MGGPIGAVATVERSAERACEDNLEADTDGLGASRSPSSLDDGVGRGAGWALCRGFRHRRAAMSIVRPID